MSNTDVTLSDPRQGHTADTPGNVDRESIAEYPGRLSGQNYLPVLDCLRGIAALSVCLFHFCGNSDLFPLGDPLRTAGSFGWLGVEAFFVISGFVIPYSLHMRSYRLSDGGQFLLRRLVRLEPPYFACILVVLGFYLLRMLFPGPKVDQETLCLTQIAAHAAYANAIIGYKWINPVFWTLAIEFQYYLFVGLVFPLINSRSVVVSVSTLCGVASLGFVGRGNTSLLPHWLPLFAIGMLAFRYKVSAVNAGVALCQLVVISTVSLYVIGVVQTIVGVATASAILLFGKASLPPYAKPFMAAGTISYSLYLLHFPVGLRVINVANRLPEHWLYRYGGVAAALIVSLVAAAVFYRLVERPSQAWSKRLGDR